jgi:O-antigen ligase
LVTRRVGIGKALPLYLLVGALLLASLPEARSITSWARTEVTASQGSRSNEERLDATISGFAIGLAHPFGVGAAHYPDAARASGVAMPWIMPDPHSTYAHAAAASGIVGFVFFMAIILYPLVRVYQARNHLRDKYTLYVSMFVGVYLMAATIGEVMTQPAFWALAAIAMGDAIGRAGPARSREIGETPAARQGSPGHPDDQGQSRWDEYHGQRDEKQPSLVDRSKDKLTREPGDNQEGQAPPQETRP